MDIHRSPLLQGVLRVVLGDFFRIKMQKNKITFVSTMAAVPWGGSEVLWSETAVELGRRGNIVNFSYPNWPLIPEPVEQLISDPRITSYRFHPEFLPFRTRLLNRIRRQIHIDEFNADLSWLQACAPDLLCISSGNAFEGLRWMYNARKLGIPYVTLAQAHAEFLWPADEELCLLNEHFASAKRCFFVSNANLRLVETQLGVFLDNAEVICNHSATIPSASIQWPDEAMYRLACVARLHPGSKGQDLIVKVMAQSIWKCRPIEVHLYGAGPNEDSIRRLVNILGVQDKIIFRGHVDNISEVWRECHGLLLPSRYEGRPLAIAEAMQCGRISIVTDVGGNAELIDHAATGWIIRAPTEGDLSITLEEAWASRTTWRSMGIEARMSSRAKLIKEPALHFASRLENLSLANSSC